MKKIVISTMLLSSLVLGTTLTANAENFEGKTKGDIQLKDGKGSEGGPDDPGDKTDPVDPEVPEEIDPPEDGGDKTEGALKFAYVPNLKFGDNNMIQAKGNAHYYARYTNVVIKETQQKEKRASFFQVDDVRGGAKGWKVSLANNGIFETPDKKYSMKANLYINDMTIRTNSGIAEKPTVKNDLVGTELSKYTKISTSDNSGVEIVTAVPGTGFGSWSVRIGSTGNPINQEVNNGSKQKEVEERNPAVMLEVLPGMKVTDSVYSTDLIWNLSDTI
ncbi:WxL domain-containing protein [Vagococcus sp. DIV0080]|uniref:WxL domain-containing protein n=1 Tax=Candidatus Vagococcus giribetii TaxID=2230876 RepID=A0ABS3HU95_9ENTE|nr:WxL domain-containing protein [Vagococcus sp. DIV0080]MBO0477329.1 WxL domain-containing protein [Vagococcus sp. DIV0080]